MGDEEESDEPDRDETKDDKPTDKDDPFPISLGHAARNLQDQRLEQELGQAQGVSAPAFPVVQLLPSPQPEEIRALRLRENASQAVFARHLNVTAGLVSQWERGEKRPRGASMKLLALVAKNGLAAVA